MVDFPYGLKPGLSYNVAITTGGSAASANPVTPGVRMLRLAVVSPTVGCKFIVQAGSPVAVSATATYLPAGNVEYVQCSGNGNEKVAAIAVGGSATLNITEMTQ